MLQGSLIIIVFIIIAALMMTKKIPTLLALPLMAVVICIIAGVPAVGTDADGNAIGWLQAVVEAGTVRMGSAIMAVIFGAWTADEQDRRYGEHHKKERRTGRGPSVDCYADYGSGLCHPVYHIERSGFYYHGWFYRPADSDLGWCAGYECCLYFPDGI